MRLVGPCLCWKSWDSSKSHSVFALINDTPSSHMRRHDNIDVLSRVLKDYIETEQLP